MNQDDRLGPYRLLRRLGEGGMGVVHLALDSQGRQVAVKVLRAEVTSDDVARRRLAREVETMRRVRSRHIAEVVDADVTGSRPYIVTRYVPGKPLDDMVKQEGPLTVAGLLRLAHGVAEALAAVHAAGVIHRDLKPGNVLMLDGEPVLIDFGIAQAVDATRLTQTGMFIGTPGYLAPEIIEGHEAGPEVDVHAWAGTMLMAATGQPPFGKGTLEMVFYNITAGKANVEAAPAIIRPLLRAAFQRDPAKRPSAAELAAQLSRLVPPRPGQARPRVPDEILTVPDMSEGPATGTSMPRPEPPRVDPTPPLPPTSPRQNAPGRPWTGQPPAARTGQQTGPPQTGRPPVRPASGAPEEEYVSLLGEAPQAPAPGDPWPTVRVTGDDLRKAGLPYQRPGSEVPAQGGSEAQNRYTPPVPSQPWQPAQPDQGEVPTRRVRPEELNDLGAQAKAYRSTPVPPATPSGQGTPPRSGQPPVAPDPRPYHHQALFEQAPDIFEMTPHIRQAPSPPYVPTVHLPPEATPGFAGGALRRSPVYGVASVLVLVIVVAAAVVAPVLVAAVVVVAAVLLRAADMAQPRLDATRPPAASAGDVLRVLAMPGPLLKSIGVTLALVPYALILGVPVTLVLTFLVRSVPVGTALSWGVAVSLWIICAGPGVEGPGRQLTRTMASAFPAKGAAVGVAAVLGVLATIVALYAASTLIMPLGEAVWSPVNIDTWLERLEGLRGKAG
ncbi:serine/threonine-protein kinase [Sphaerisporangium corydalis]|uniref:Protein kinase n=1 Tax=Sphaerisporangium corydalis TaxID=1441875 RepID=A0ABV9EH83_9ACTN|nr:serine/threonine-protein kinase [Sphaerisporangium corydalis]